jgi:hypothetical protein
MPSGRETNTMIDYWIHVIKDGEYIQRVLLSFENDSINNTDFED